MMHEEFAERVAERLEARAAQLVHGSQPAPHDAATSRATVLRTAAAIALQEDAAGTEEEAPPPEVQA